MQMDVRTRVQTTKRHGVEIVMTVALLPRGSGNRGKAARLAKQFKTDPVLGSHVLSAVAGASKVTVRLRPSLALAVIIATWPNKKDVPGQLPLPGVEELPALA